MLDACEFILVCHNLRLVSVLLDHGADSSLLLHLVVVFICYGLHVVYQVEL